MERASSANKYHYNPKLKKLAHELRYSMTKSEAVLWKHTLSRKKMLGLSFDRQRSVLNYIADFMCRELLLIIEVDGITHHFSDISENDGVRQKELESIGFTVLRFSSEEVLQNLKQVTSVIQRQCEVLQESS